MPTYFTTTWSKTNWRLERGNSASVTQKNERRRLQIRMRSLRIRCLVTFPYMHDFLDHGAIVETKSLIN